MRVEPAVDHLVRAVLLRQQTQVRLDHAAAQAQGRLERAVREYLNTKLSLASVYRMSCAF